MDKAKAYIGMIKGQVLKLNLLKHRIFSYFIRTFDPMKNAPSGR